MALSLGAAGADLGRARELYQRTDYAGALRLLQSAPADDVAALILTGRAHFMAGDAKQASDVLERAVAIAPKSSEAHLWLGRAYGRRAETSSYFTAPRYASRARQAFEQSVALDSKNNEAINDLFEYYLQAPGFLGGGTDKAQALARKIGESDPAEYHYALAQIAEHQKEYNAAEQQLRRAMELAPRQVGRIVDLAKFLYKRGRVQEGEETFAKAEKVAPQSPKVLFARAQVYIATGQNRDRARGLLQRYLKSPLTPEDPSREAAERLLRQVGG